MALAYDVQSVQQTLCDATKNLSVLDCARHTQDYTMDGQKIVLPIAEMHSKQAFNVMLLSPPQKQLTDKNETFYEIKPATTLDYSAVLDHLRRFFFQDEPLNVNVRLLEDTDTCIELEEFCIKNLSYGCSFVAIAADGSVVGAAVNAIERRSDAADDDEEQECANLKFRKILNLLSTVEREVDIFNRYADVDTVLNCKILSVDTNWRGRGIAKKLLDKTREFGQVEKYEMMRVDCTSHFSAKAIARLGFEEIYTKNYADYKENGKVVFDPEAPHTAVSVFIQRIHE